MLLFKHITEECCERVSSFINRLVLYHSKQTQERNEINLNQSDSHENSIITPLHRLEFIIQM